MSAGGIRNDPRKAVYERDGSIGLRGLQDFEELRRLVFLGVSESLARDGYCKSYEGQLELIAPNYFEVRDDERQAFWRIELHCYVLGPSRHYVWEGNSLEVACEAAIASVSEWVEQARREDAE